MWPKTRRTCLRRDVLGRQADTHRQATVANPWIRGGSACLLQAGNAVFRSQGPDADRMDFINGLSDLGTEFLRFGGQVGAVVIVAAVLGGFPLYLYWGVEMVHAAAVGFGIGALNALAGGLSAIWSFDRPQSVFLKTLLGGMVLRMLVICGVLVLLIEITALSIYGLVFSLFLSYLLFQILEIRFFVRRAAVRRATKEGV